MNCYKNRVPAVLNENENWLKTNIRENKGSIENHLKIIWNTAGKLIVNNQRKRAVDLPKNWASMSWALENLLSSKMLLWKLDLLMLDRYGMFNSSVL